MSSISASLNSLLPTSLASTSTSVASELSSLFGTQSGGLASALTGSSDPTQISQIGQFLNNLQTLKENNPSQFQQLTTNIASELSSAASQAGTSTSQGQFLSKLSTSFQNIANGGSLSQLLPPTQTAQSLASQAYLQVQQSVNQSLLQAFDGSSSDSSSSTDSLQSLLSSVGTGSSSPTDSLSSVLSSLGTSSSSSSLQSLLSSDSSSSGNSSSSSILQAIFQQVQQAATSATSNVATG